MTQSDKDDLVKVLGKALDVGFRATKAAYKEASKPESHVKGERFEDFVLKMFPESEWVLVKKTQNYTSNKERYEEMSKEPDFFFRHRRSGREIYVECKWRADAFNDKIEWCSPSQLERYKAIDSRNNNVYVVIGFRGTSNNPERIFSIPLSEIKWTGLYSSFVRNFEVNKNHKFVLEFGKLR